MGNRHSFDIISFMQLSEADSASEPEDDILKGGIMQNLLF